MIPPDGIPAGGAIAFLLWGALVSLDEKTLGLSLLSQPAIAGFVAGTCFGQPLGGLAAGLVFQVLWPAPAAVGGVVLPSSGLAAVVAGGALAILGPRGLDPQIVRAARPLEWLERVPVVLPSLALGMIAAQVGGIWEAGLRKRCSIWEGRALALPPEQVPAALGAAVRRTSLLEALRGLVIAGLGLLAASLPGGAGEGVIEGLRRWTVSGPWVACGAVGLGVGTLLWRSRPPNRRVPAEWLGGIFLGALWALAARWLAE